MKAQGSKPDTAATEQEQRTFPSPAFARRLDAAFAAALAKGVGDMPPQQALLAWFDWASHLALAPGKQAQLLAAAAREYGALLKGALKQEQPAEPRYAAAAWKRRPFSLLARAASTNRRLWDAATSEVPGLDRGNAALIHFYGVQLLEALAPDHWPLTNPEVLDQTRSSRGGNLARGARTLADDVWNRLRRKPAAALDFKVGENLAVTPGRVIHRNRLMELIQYSPTTPDVHAEPVLIVPAWIMKYYILDLQAQNSMVRWLVGQGFTVFMISWKNPVAEDRDLGMDDYRSLGVLEALEAIRAVLPRRKVHAVGYCVGGTLLSISAAAMARDGDHRLKSITLFAAQTDFADPGELGLFINESTLHWLDAQMARRGYLTAGQMAGAFSALRAHDLVWAPLLRRYWMGENGKGIDIMAWNADTTRMPYRMHSDYLRQLYLRNELAQGKYRIGGGAVSVGDIRVPMFVVGTVTDHVAPWHSVYKIRKLRKLGETTFVLTNGGHNAGIVSEPGRPRRSYRIDTWDENRPYQSPQDWEAKAPLQEGSWWPAWGGWLAAQQPAKRVAPPAMGAAEQGYAPLCDAPGTYIHQR
ncbi:MAG TPA: alpha/beta fold hydrolase [Nevskia sp.]|nr:alpha/beta fold hydrolase [Nevskia sp.]